MPSAFEQLRDIASRVKDYTGLQVEYQERPPHIGPSTYSLVFRTPWSDPGDNHTIVGRTRLSVNHTDHRLYQLRNDRCIYPDLAELVDTVLAVYYDNLEDS